MDGVHRFFDASIFETEKLGSNKIGPVSKDEECFASDRRSVLSLLKRISCGCCRQGIYKRLPSVTTIEEAIQSESFILPVHVIDSGNVDKGFSDSGGWHPFLRSIRVFDEFVISNDESRAFPLRCCV
ncbi:hypothetical protein CCR75_000469 [Bremia lactucae]|uniref:Uncharacterized protein n=1 Tax=Bremia lactucae TaxID=4779 RepID=A0A976FL99_BRELC|nr:hypothetical protein CCR75_000469 [Bremia lactucae]